MEPVLAAKKPSVLMQTCKLWVRRSSRAALARKATPACNQRWLDASLSSQDAKRVNLLALVDKSEDWAGAPLRSSHHSTSRNIRKEGLHGPSDRELLAKTRGRRTGTPEARTSQLPTPQRSQDPGRTPAHSQAEARTLQNHTTNSAAYQLAGLGFLSWPSSQPWPFLNFTGLQGQSYRWIRRQCLPSAFKHLMSTLGRRTTSCVPTCPCCFVLCWSACSRPYAACLLALWLPLALLEPSKTPPC